MFDGIPTWELKEAHKALVNCRDSLDRIPSFKMWANFFDILCYMFEAEMFRREERDDEDN